MITIKLVFLPGLLALGACGGPSTEALLCDRDDDCPGLEYCDTSSDGVCRPVTSECGDGSVDEGEACDDGNNRSGDGCRFDCRGEEICGDGVVDLGEQCDDGNGVDDDECPTTCVLTCGDGIVSSGEVCDDANAIETDACLAECAAARCGDGFVHVGQELCDDGNNESGDGCDAICGHEGVVQVAVGDGHSCALFAGGAVRCWGAGANGRLGYGDVADIAEGDIAGAGSVDVGGVVTQISAGARHTCALLEGGRVRCWGANNTGQLGYGHSEVIGDNEPPSSAGDVDVGGPVKQISAGGYHTCALLESGAVRCWGWNTYGTLGYGHKEQVGDDETPASAGDAQVGGRAIQIAAGELHTCALLDTGAVRCWGWNLFGQLGYGHTRPVGDDETPGSAGDVDLGGRALAIAVSGAQQSDGHTCALLEGGKVRCWGSGFFGRLGYGNTEHIGDDEVPSSAGDVDVGGTVVSVAVGTIHTCALLSTGALRCWGNSNMIGRGSAEHIGDDESPASAGDLDSGGLVVKIATGVGRSCVLLASGKVRCFAGAPPTDDLDLGES